MKAHEAYEILAARQVLARRYLNRSPMLAVWTLSEVNCKIDSILK